MRSTLDMGHLLTLKNLVLGSFSTLHLPLHLFSPERLIMLGSAELLPRGFTLEFALTVLAHLWIPSLYVRHDLMHDNVLVDKMSRGHIRFRLDTDLVLACG